MKQLILVLLLLFAAPSYSNDQSFDVSRVWSAADVYVPDTFFRKNVDSVEVTRPMPVVIYMHGCGGMSADDAWWGNFLKKQGYIVVVPDSFATFGRPRNCDQTSRNLGLVNAKKLRLAEIKYTLDKVKSQSWADQDNIFLMGHSEGGMAVSQTQVNGVKGIISTGYTCRRGVKANENIPVLAVQFEVDHLFTEQTKCSERWDNRYNSTEVILPGAGHSAASNDAASDAVLTFLRKHTR